MTTVIMRKRGTLVIPAELRARYGLDDGVAIEIEEKVDGIMIRTAARPKPAFDESAFWREFEKSVAQLKADPVAWAAYRAEFEATELFEGLEGEPPYPL